MRSRWKPFISIALIVLLAGCKASTINEILRSTQGPLDEETVAAGLKEALRVGTDRTVSATSIVDGFLGNAAIRILMPEELESAASALRTVGLGSKVDEFEVAMNRAAEKASGEARSVFWSAITSMTLADAFGILNGHDTAATEYFQDRTSGELRTRFMPIVRDKMSQVGLYRVYNQLMDAYTALPLVSEPTFDLDSYVTERSLAGLFTVLGGEERRIREDPAARTTELLKRVFAER